MEPDLESVDPIEPHRGPSGACAVPARTARWHDRRQLGAIFAGGFLGTLARAALAQALGARAGQWPWATFAVNLAGAALLGWFVTRLRQRPPHTPYARAFLASGLCGGLTTFSTVMVQLVQMLEGAHAALALAYAAATLCGGLGCAFAAADRARRRNPLR